MKAQAALEFLYTYGFVIIIALAIIAIIFHYFSLSLGSAPQCFLPYYLTCEQFYISPTELQLNVTNNFDYKIKLNSIIVGTRDDSFTKNLNVQLDRGKSYVIKVPINAKGKQFYGKLNVSYSLCPGTCDNEKYHLIGFVTGTVEK